LKLAQVKANHNQIENLLIQIENENITILKIFTEVKNILLKNIKHEITKKQSLHRLYQVNSNMHRLTDDQYYFNEYNTYLKALFDLDNFDEYLVGSVIKELQRQGRHLLAMDYAKKFSNLNTKDGTRIYYHSKLTSLHSINRYLFLKELEALPLTNTLMKIREDMNRKDKDLNGYCQSRQHGVLKNGVIKSLNGKDVFEIDKIQSISDLVHILEEPVSVYFSTTENKDNSIKTANFIEPYYKEVPVLKEQLKKLLWPST